MSLDSILASVLLPGGVSCQCGTEGLSELGKKVRCSRQVLPLPLVVEKKVHDENKTLLNVDKTKANVRSFGIWS